MTKSGSRISLTKTTSCLGAYKTAISHGSGGNSKGIAGMQRPPSNNIDRRRVSPLGTGSVASAREASEQSVTDPGLVSQNTFSVPGPDVVTREYSRDDPEAILAGSDVEHGDNSSHGSSESSDRESSDDGLGREDIHDRVNWANLNDANPFDGSPSDDSSSSSSSDSGSTSSRSHVPSGSDGGRSLSATVQELTEDDEIENTAIEDEDSEAGTKVDNRSTTGESQPSIIDRVENTRLSPSEHEGGLEMGGEDPDVLGLGEQENDLDLEDLDDDGYLEIIEEVEAAIEEDFDRNNDQILQHPRFYKRKKTKPTQKEMATLGLGDIASRYEQYFPSFPATSHENAGNYPRQIYATSV